MPKHGSAIEWIVGGFVIAGSCGLVGGVVVVEGSVDVGFDCTMLLAKTTGLYFIKYCQ